MTPADHPEEPRTITVYAQQRCVCGLADHPAQTTLRCDLCDSTGWVRGLVAMMTPAGLRELAAKLVGGDA